MVKGVFTVNAINIDMLVKVVNRALASVPFQFNTAELLVAFNVIANHHSETAKKGMK